MKECNLSLRVFPESGQKQRKNNLKKKSGKKREPSKFLMINFSKIFADHYSQRFPLGKIVFTGSGWTNLHGRICQKFSFCKKSFQRFIHFKRNNPRMMVSQSY